MVKNNLVYGNRNYGVQLYPSGSDNVIAYNTIVGNGITTGKSGIVLGGSVSMTGNRIVFERHFFQWRLGCSRVRLERFL